MSAAFEIVLYAEVVARDIPALDTAIRGRVKTAIDTKLTTAPQTYGSPLRQSLKGWRKLRVGDYRVVFRIRGKVVEIAAIQHRSVIYDRIRKRMK